MKKIIFYSIFVVFFSLVGFSSVSASQFSEKIWTVTMNTSILNTEENLAHVVILDSENNEIEAKIILNEQANSIEVYPVDEYAKGNYTLVIKAGFKAANNMVLQKDYNYKFTVVKSFAKANLLGKWKTDYTYEGKHYDILVDFKDISADITLKLDEGVNFIARDQVYNLFTEGMELFVREGEKNIDLSGRILLYSDKKFRILTLGGKTAIFEKVK